MFPPPSINIKSDAISNQRLLLIKVQRTMCRLDLVHSASSYHRNLSGTLQEAFAIVQARGPLLFATGVLGILPCGIFGSDEDKKCRVYFSQYCYTFYLLFPLNFGRFVLSGNCGASHSHALVLPKTLPSYPIFL